MPLGTDCAEIWYVVRDPLARPFTEVDAGLQLHVHTVFPHLGNGWTDCAEIPCVVMGPAAMRFIGITSGAHCTCARAHNFSYLSNRGTLCCEIWFVVRHALIVCFTQVQ